MTTQTPDFKIAGEYTELIKSLDGSIEYSTNIRDKEYNTFVGVHYSPSEDRVIFEDLVDVDGDISLKTEDILRVAKWIEGVKAHHATSEQ